VVPNEAVVQGQRRVVGYQQLAAFSVLTKITPPTQTYPGPTGAQVNTVELPAGFAVIQNNGSNPVRWRDDGTAPTTTVGMLLNPGAELDYNGDVYALQFIPTVNPATLDVSLYA
jgi:hypothetical protein